jgi:hypothetical protein
MTYAAQIKRAELASGIGALVLGLGLGAIGARLVAPGALGVLAAGGVLHAWGMHDKHRLERGTETGSVRYAAALYRTCWAMLLAVLVYLGLRAFA